MRDQANSVTKLSKQESVFLEQYEIYFLLISHAIIAYFLRVKTILHAKPFTYKCVLLALFFYALSKFISCERFWTRTRFETATKLKVR